MSEPTLGSEQRAAAISEVTKKAENVRFIQT